MDKVSFILFLMLMPKFGVKRIKHLLTDFDGEAIPTLEQCEQCSTQSFLLQLRGFYFQSGKIWHRLTDLMLSIDRLSIHLLHYQSHDYPFLLRQIPDCPVLLFVKGDARYLHQPQLAIVGSRNASAVNLRHAYRFSRDVSLHGLIVTSGLAQGVDGAAHQAAIDADHPTVAVMACGLDRVYPASHRIMASHIESHGCLVSEFLPGVAPLRSNFPRRNRLISGLSFGVLIVEARFKSGTLITARTALEQNREVFALPGSIDYQGSAGCHLLIQQGAKLVVSVSCILEELAQFSAFGHDHSNGCDSGSLVFTNKVQQLSSLDQQNSLSQNVEDSLVSNEAKSVLDFVPYDQSAFECTFESIVLRSGLAVSVLGEYLLELEMYGYISVNTVGYSRIR